ncbi:kinase-like protein [Mucor ambiguus]|uniref:Kinase-like protein n=1 Tax=Mucor ambiguus TaxID=91626 RepID=A0A0C9M5I6_9FUNG|nr:kinase-like protein [Mucor ambiguus]
MIFETLNRHVDSSLEMIDRDSLDKLMLADIIEYCQERGLKTEGAKADLIEDLISWVTIVRLNHTHQKLIPSEQKENIRLIPAPSTPRLYTALELLPDSSSTLPPQQRLELNSRDLSMLFLDDKNPDFDIPYHALVVGKKLGSGGFKDCYTGMYKGVGRKTHAACLSLNLIKFTTIQEPVAIGELRLTHFNQVDLDEIKHEINVLKQLRHENVIRFIGVCTHPQHLCIITELCAKGDLFDVIRCYKKPNFSQLVMYMYDIALGVSYLHTRSQNSPESKHIDAHTLWNTKLVQWHRSTPEYWSSNPSYTEKVDIYACGLIFWEILSWGEYGYPFQDLTEHALYVAVKDHRTRPPLGKLSQIYPHQLLLLIMEMWDSDPTMRPSMNQVVDILSNYLT